MNRSWQKPLFCAKNEEFFGKYLRSEKNVKNLTFNFGYLKEYLYTL